VTRRINALKPTFYTFAAASTFAFIAAVVLKLI
jgi:hypothetical protein